MTTTPLRVVVAINPSASFGRGGGTGPAVLERLRASGHDVVPLQEASWADLERAARDAVREHCDAFVVVGGDGMVNLGANVTATTGVPLGIVPSGTGNDTARALGIPLDDTSGALDVLERALASGPRVADAATSTGPDGERRWFANVLSAGFDAIVNERANAMRWPKGPRRYTLAILIELLRLRSRRYRLELDGEALERDSVLICAANGQYLGGGMHVTPMADFSDGLLDLMVVAPLGRARFLRIFPKVFSGSHVGLSIVEFRRARRIRIDADGIIAYGDGERFGPLPVDIELVPGALRLLV